MDSSAVTDAQVEMMTPVLMAFMTGMKDLAPEVTAKYMAEREATKGKDPTTTEDFQKHMELFDAADANSDGHLDKDEMMVFKSSVEAYRTTKYGGFPAMAPEHVETWVKCMFTISEPHDSMTKDDLKLAGAIMKKCSEKLGA